MQFTRRRPKEQAKKVAEHYDQRSTGNMLRAIIASALGSALFSLVTFSVLYIWKASGTDMGFTDFLRKGLAVPAWLFICSHVLLGVIVFLVARHGHIRT